MKRIGWLFALIACSGFAVEPEQIQRRKVPPLPSAQGDERGMANQIGPATYQRCAWHGGGGPAPGQAGPAPGTPPGLPFAVHHHMLAQAGIHLVENAKLDELAAERIWTSCTMILPLRDRGAAGSAVRPIAIGAPSKTAAQK